MCGCDFIFTMSFTNYRIVYLGSSNIILKKRSIIMYRMKTDGKAIDILLPNILLYMHWTQEQILLFFPNHVLDFSCGICTLDHSNVDRLYEKL